MFREVHLYYSIKCSKKYDANIVRKRNRVNINVQIYKKYFFCVDYNLMNPIIVFMS